MFLPMKADGLAPSELAFSCLPLPVLRAEEEDAEEAIILGALDCIVVVVVFRVN